MKTEEKFEKILYISLLVLIIFTAGVQCGIYHGRELAQQELQEVNYGY